RRIRPRLIPFAPNRHTKQAHSGSGTGPEQSLEAIKPPLAHRAKAYPSPSFPARAGPVPRSTTQQRTEKPPHCGACPQSNSGFTLCEPVPKLSEPPDNLEAAAGPGRSKHWKRSNFPSRTARKPILPRASLRAQDRSRGARPNNAPKNRPHSEPVPNENE
ncbi:MAG: hypothetical protein RLZZ582_250, partial [Verrucomicrobiota bacterium]